MKFRIKLGIGERMFLVEELFLKYVRVMICDKHAFVWGLVDEADYPKESFSRNFIQESPYVSVLAGRIKPHISSILVK